MNAQHTPGPFTFVRVVRDSPTNEKIKSGKLPGPLIYDFDVLKDGERVAEFRSRVGRIGYELHDRIGRPILEPGRDWRNHVGERARSQALFLQTLEKCEGVIPTARQCAAAQRAEARGRERQKAAARREEEAARVRRAAPALLAALSALLAEVTTPDQQWVAGSAVTRARAVIDQATGSAA